MITNLNDEDLKNVSGGYIFENEMGDIEVIDSEGNVVKRFGYHEYAAAYTWAVEHGLPGEMITWEELDRIRKEHKS